MTDLDRLTTALADRYTIEGELGAGGMATVYLAHDIKHDRKVALKVLRPELAAAIGAERFLVEIKTTANLQHPHILPLHDSGEADSFLYYVMPYVEGESLRDKLDREKQLHVDDAVRLASEVASALDYAHRHEVIHRDIKPENILVHDGSALVADFGIALAASKAGGARMTETGMSLGTPHYMSPEQAMGDRELSAASDIYALGATLYEMLAGEPPFTGPTAQSVVAKVMTAEPEPVTTYRPTVPPHVSATVLVALQKLPADRFVTAKEFADALAQPGLTHASHAANVPRPRSALKVILGATALAGGAAFIGWMVGREGGEAVSAPPSRLAIIAPRVSGSGGAAENRMLSITSDGSAVVYVVDAEGTGNQIVWQTLDAIEPTPIPNAEGRYAPVVSPDGRWVIMSGEPGQRGVLRRVPVSGGAQVSIRTPERSASTNLWVAWHRDGSAWFSNRAGDELWRLDPNSDSVEIRLSNLGGVRIQQILDDGKTALVTRASMGSATGPAYLLDLESGATKPLLETPIVQVRYTTGLVVYAQTDGTMQAVPFDLREGTVTGAPVVIADDVSITGTGVAQFDVSATGTIVYLPEEPRSLVLVERDGAVHEIAAARQNFHAPVFSPSGRRVAMDFTTADGRDVWMYDLEQETLTRVTFARDGHDPTWSSDGRFITYASSSQSGVLGTYRIRTGAGGTPPELLYSSPTLGFTGYWLPGDSRLLTVFNGLGDGSGSDLALLEPGAEEPVQPLVVTAYQDEQPTASPDGQFLAFASDLSGQFEVYLRPLDGDGEQIQVSVTGGVEPLWGPNGREVYYRTTVDNRTSLVAARVERTPRLRVTERTTLFPVDQMVASNPHRNYDVSPDGSTFVMVRRSPATRIVVIQNVAELVRRVQPPTRGTE